MQVDCGSVLACARDEPSDRSNKDEHDMHTETRFKASLRLAYKIAHGCQGGVGGMLLALDLLCD